MSKEFTAEIIQFPVVISEEAAFPVAVGAEHLSVLPFAPGGEHLPILSLVQPDTEVTEVIPLHPINTFEFAQPCGINAEMFDDLAIVIAEARETAESTMERNMELVRKREYETVPLEVDSLGTAAKVNAVKRKYGENSPEYRKVLPALVMDKDRRLDEAESKNTMRYFAPITYTHDPNKDVLYADGLSYDDVVISGLSPLGHYEERARRPHDFVKNTVNKELVKRPDSHQVAVLQVSTCPDYAIESFKKDPKGAHNGYAPEVEKNMISFDTFDPVKHEVYHEQVAVQGKYITLELINEAYQRLGLIEDGESLDKTEMYGVQGIVQLEAIGEALDFVALLDEMATQKAGLNIFMGEVVPDNHPRDYEQVKEEARQEKLLREARTEALVNYALDQEARGVDHALYNVRENKFVKDLLLDAAQEEPEIALKAFDYETAAGFQQAIALREQGRHAEAQDIIEATRLNAPAAGGCGAGSCGLESLDLISPEDQLAKLLLNAEDGDTLLRDTERKCKCGGTVYYKSNEKKKSYSKLCIGCGALEKDGKLMREGKGEVKRMQKQWLGTISKHSNN